MKLKIKLPIDPKMLIIVLAAIIISAGVSFFIAQKIVTDKLKKGGEEQQVVKSGPIMDLGEFTVNLADKIETHFARFKVSLELSNTKILGELSKPEWNVRLRDVIILTVKDKTTRDLSTSAGLLSLASEIKEAINKIIPRDKGRVLKVYFTEFLVQ